MKEGQIKDVITKILGLVFLLAAGSVFAQTNHAPYCCRYPYRVLGEGKVVNLTPLFQWWTGHGGQNQDQPAATADYPDPTRPLTAWKRVTGITTAELDAGWVVNAEVATSPTSRTNEWIILRHPPAAEEYQYGNLQSLLAQDDEQMTNDLRASAEDLKVAKRAEDRANGYASSISKSVRHYYGTDYEQLAVRYRNASAAALADEKQYEATRKQTQKLFDDLPGAKGQYVLDCFALELGRNSKGQLVFDVGAADGYSQ